MAGIDILAGNRVVADDALATPDLHADVIIEQYRPGVVSLLGIDYETISKINPRIVYCSLSGYGQDGPYRLLSGHDLNYISYAGILGLTARQGQAPTIPGVQIADIGGGALYATIGILLAVMGAQKTGEGQYVDTSMLDGAVSWLPILASDYFVTGEPPKAGSAMLIGRNACYEVYETADGKFISIAAVEPHLWANFCDLIGKEEFKAWQRDTGRQPEMFDYMRKLFKSKTQAEWCEFLKGCDCCWAPVLGVDEVFSNEQVLHRDMLFEMEDPQGQYGSVKQIGSAIKLSRTPARRELFPPRKGEHNAEYLGKCGYTPEQIAKFAEEGII